MIGIEQAQQISCDDSRKSKPQQHVALIEGCQCHNLNKRSTAKGCVSRHTTMTFYLPGVFFWHHHMDSVIPHDPLGCCCMFCKYTTNQVSCSTKYLSADLVSAHTMFLCARDLFSTHSRGAVMRAAGNAWQHVLFTAAVPQLGSTAQERVTWHTYTRDAYLASSSGVITCALPHAPIAI